MNFPYHTEFVSQHVDHFKLTKNFDINVGKNELFSARRGWGKCWFQKKCWVKKNLNQKNISSDQDHSPKKWTKYKNFCPQKFKVLKIWVRKKYGPTKFRSKKVFFLMWTNFARTIVTVAPEIYFWGLVKIRSITAEIFLIWTNIEWTNVAWTNVTVTFGICFRCSQEPNCKVSSKSGQ